MRLMSLLLPPALLMAATATFAAPPVAEVKDVPTTYHGTTVPDPYRWLEDSKSAPAQTWLKGQGAAARSVLDRIDGRDAIAQRLAELADAQGDAVGSLMRLPGERYYYLKRKVGEKQFKLVMRQGLSGAERLLVDPEAETARTGVPHAINYFKPSWDGKHLAYGMSAGGSEDASLYVMDIASGKQVGAPVPRVFDVGIHWLPDSRSYTYTQTVEMKPGQPVVETYMDARVLRQRLGAKTAQPVFGPTVTPQLGLVRLDVGQLYTVPGSRWVVARTTDTTVPEGKLFAARLADLGKPNARWQRLATEADKVVDIALQGDHLYVMTQAGAPRRKVVRIDLNKPMALAQAPVVAAEPKDGALQGFDLTPTALIAQLRQGTSVLLRRYARGDTVGRNLPAPTAGTAWLTSAPAQDSEALLYVFSSWTEPTRWLRLDNGLSTDVAFGARRVPANLPDVVVTDVNVDSHDGVKVPMTILHKRGLALDGRNPVLLDGYASYGFSTSAYFSTQTMAWIERGGVAAFINPRGSGVHGDEWHRAPCRLQDHQAQHLEGRHRRREVPHRQGLRVAQDHGHHGRQCRGHLRRPRGDRSARTLRGSHLRSWPVGRRSCGGKRQRRHQHQRVRHRQGPGRVQGAAGDEHLPRDQGRHRLPRRDVGARHERSARGRLAERQGRRAAAGGAGRPAGCAPHPAAPGRPGRSRHGQHAHAAPGTGGRHAEFPALADGQAGAEGLSR